METLLIGDRAIDIFGVNVVVVTDDQLRIFVVLAKMLNRAL
jgi:hypothetical protein